MQGITNNPPRLFQVFKRHLNFQYKWESLATNDLLPGEDWGERRRRVVWVSPEKKELMGR